MKLNPEQERVVNAIDGDWVVIASAGTGKTHCLIQRYMSMLCRGIYDSDILNLSFTNAAATEMVKRAGLPGTDSVFRTFHSWALDLLNRNREHIPFQLCEKIIPVQGQDYQLLFDLCKVYPAIKNFRILKEKISEWKRTNVDPEKALEESNGADYYLALAYGDYEYKCRQAGWL